MEMELDRISYLPSDVTGKILSHLPIREAARTSVLSSNWRNKWPMLTHLVFDDQCTSSQNHRTFARIVDHVLMGHIGPIYKFKAFHPVSQAGRDIDRWILHLSRNSIRQLFLNIKCRGHRYKVPSCLFSCQDLIVLVLQNCFLKPPSTFNGFRSLKRLGFVNVTLDQDVLENLIVCCPLLERLFLLNCDGPTHLKVDAPNLSYLQFSGVLKDVSLPNTLKLLEAAICLTPTSTVSVANDRRRSAGSSNNLLKFFVHLPHIRRLCIEDYLLKYLADGVLPGKLPQPHQDLNFLSIHISFNDAKEILTALCLLRSFSALQELEIFARKEDQAVVGEVNHVLGNNENCQLTKLRLVKVTGISGVKAELDFIRFLLSSSPVLKKMTVMPATVNNFQLVKKLLQFKRVSEHAEIFYLDP